MGRLILKLWIIVGLLLLLCQGIASKAAGPSPDPEPLKSVGTAFTYQGRLTDANQPADGRYNFRFKLFDGPTDGNQVGITVDVNNVDVIDGYFTVELDFVSEILRGQQGRVLGDVINDLWGGEARWMEIGVWLAYRLMAEPDPLPLVYTILSPRQKITPVPYALYALSGGGGTGLLAPPSSGGIYDVLRWYSSWKISPPLPPGDANGASIYNLGKLDIGPLVLPGAKLHVHGTTVVSEDGIETVFGTAGRPGYRFWGGEPTVLAGIGEHMGMFGAADNELAFSTSSSEWMRINSIGNVGVGTKTPSNKLDVESGGLGQIEVRGIDTTGFGGFDIFSDSPWFGWAGVGGKACPIADIRDNFFINIGGVQPTFQSTGDEPAPAASSGAGAGGIVFLTGGLTRAIIRNTGDVGIGTTTPGAKLEVAGQVKITGGSPGPGKVLTSDAAGLANWQTPISPAGDNLGNHIATQNIQLNGHYLSGDGGDEGVYVTNAGNVGIGTTSPQQALDLGSGTSGRAIVWGGPSGANWYDTIGASFSSSALSLLYMLKIDPAADRYLVSYTGNYPHTGIRIHDGIYFFAGPLASRSAGDAFDFTSATRLFIKDDGNIGIGTTTPGAKLHVSTSAALGIGLMVEHNGDGQVAIQGISHDTVGPKSGIGVLGISDNMGVEGIGDVIGVKGVSSTSGGQAINGVASGGAYAGIFTGGNVGIGTESPKQKLDVSQGNIILSEPNSTMRYILLQRNGSEVGSLSTANGRITIGAESGFDAMIQNSSAAGIIVKNTSGNVGIGMTDPSEKLDVIGTARLRGITASTGTIVVADGTGKLFKQSSSRRYKTNIQNLEDDADKILELRPVRFQWKTTGQDDIGLIAEEVEAVAKDLVIYDQEGKADAVKYDKVSLYLLKVVKDLKSENDSLRQRLETLEKKVGQMQPAYAKEVQ